jgi:two-component system LytT family response regulator
MSQNSQNYRVIVIDDEPWARLALCSLINKDSELVIVAECENGYEAIAAIKEYAPDLIFLDIQMAEVNGFQVLEQIDTEKMPAIIFVTAFEQYAINAFEVNALDYLLKPVEESRFKKAVKQAKDHMMQSEMSSLNQRLITLLKNESYKEPAPKYLERIVIKSTGKVMFLPVCEIELIEADDYYVKIHAASRCHLVRETMKELEKTLNPNQFQRIHRSIIVNLDHIKEVQSDFQNKSVVVLNNGRKLKMSRPLQDLIMRMKAHH